MVGEGNSRHVVLPESVREYAQAQGYPAVFSLLYLVIGLGCLVTGMGLVFGYSQTESFVHQPGGSIADDPIIYEMILPGFHYVVGIFVAILASAWPTYTIALSWRRFGEYVAIETFDQTLDAFFFGKAILRGVQRRIKTDDPAEYLYQFNRGMRRAFTKGAMVLGVPLIVIGFFDYNFFKALTHDGVVHSPYWSVRTVHRSIDDVARVDVGCWTYDDEADPTFELVFSDGWTFDLFEAGVNADAVDAVASIDRELQSRDTPKVRDWMEGTVLLFAARYRYSEKCGPLLARQYGRGTASRIMALVTPDKEPDDLFDFPKTK